LLKITGEQEREFVTRFQQVTGPVMAKGAEDTAFYCYHRFIALNEVGGDPARFALTVEQFHSWCKHMQQHWPKTMLGTSTHDTKRSEDVRARLVVLSEMPARWIEQVSAWSKRHAKYWSTSKADHNFEYFWYQTLVGAWPLEQARGLSYCEKAVREAKSFTSWTDPQAEYENAVFSFVERLYQDAEFIQELEQLVNELEECGHQTSLSQTLIKMTAPGIPDIYQGTELWDFSLADPDNRRPVDFECRRRLLDELPRLAHQEVWHRRREGLPKLWLLWRCLRVRQERSSSFGAHGTYSPLYAEGQKAAHVVSFKRSDDIISIAPRLFWSLKQGWGDTVVRLPDGQWRQEFDGQLYAGGICQLQDILRTFPVALLCKVA
jgi:(1->4)-alpha-D-glucan 1-alpha-D-glucosylmutase